MVDMIATNNNPFGRVLVSVIDSKAFPHRLCVVIGDRWYECPVRVESIIPRVKSYVEVIKHDDDPEGNDDDALGDDGYKDNNNGRRKKSKSGQNKSQTGVGGDRMDVDPNKNSDGDRNQQKVPEDQLRVMANEILDCVVSSLIGEVAEKVATEEDDSEGWADQYKPDDGLKVQETEGHFSDVGKNAEQEIVCAEAANKNSSRICDTRLWRGWCRQS